MRLKYNFSINKVVNKYTAVAIGDDAKSFHSIVFLNNVGKEIFEYLKQDITMEMLVNGVCKSYEGDLKVIRNEITLFVNKLRNMDFLID